MPAWQRLWECPRAGGQVTSVARPAWFIPDLAQEGMLGNSLRTAVAVHTTPDFHTTCPFLFFLSGVISVVARLLLSIAVELKKETKKNIFIWTEREVWRWLSFFLPRLPHLTRRHVG